MINHWCLWGNKATLKVDPIAFGGKFLANLARTAPPLP
jgi:hypothetical protein